MFDLDSARATSFVQEHAATVATDIGEVGGKREIIVTMLPTGKDVRAVLMEMDGGLAGHLKPGTLVVNMSSHPSPSAPWNWAPNWRPMISF